MRIADSNPRRSSLAALAGSQQSGAQRTGAPSGTRHVTTARGQVLEYQLCRSPRRSIGLVIHDAGLVVRAPPWASRQQIEDLIVRKTPWIQDKLKTRDARLREQARMAMQWRDGGHIPYLGTAITLRLDPVQATHYVGDPLAPSAGDRLMLKLPVHTPAATVRHKAEAWLRLRAQIDFQVRMTHFLARANQAPCAWSLSNAIGRWGSCSAQRHIRLNWRLIHLDPALIDYVVAHEVAHLAHMNHSPDFWAQVDTLYPDFRRTRQILRNHHPRDLPAVPVPDEPIPTRRAC